MNWIVAIAALAVVVIVFITLNGMKPFRYASSAFCALLSTFQFNMFTKALYLRHLDSNQCPPRSLEKSEI